MTLDEYIKKTEEEAKQAEFDTEWGIGNYFIDRTEVLECSKEFRQLAEWLRELKAYREILANADNIIVSIYGCVIFEGYADVIDRMKEIYEKNIKNHMAESGD